MKDYVIWRQVKASIHNRAQTMLFHEREIWWCSIGENVGFEEDGKGLKFTRPVIILKKFNEELFLGVPLTTSIKRNHYYITVSVDGKEGAAMISQLKAYSARRLIRRIEKQPEEDFIRVLRAIIMMLKKVGSRYAGSSGA